MVRMRYCGLKPQFIPWTAGYFRFFPSLISLALTSVSRYNGIVRAGE